MTRDLHDTPRGSEEDRPPSLRRAARAGGRFHQGPSQLRLRPVPAALLLLAALLVPGGGVPALTLARMNLEDLCLRAHRIFSGTVIEAGSGTIEAGGGELPVVRYTVVVDDAFKGSFTETKGRALARITMLGKFRHVERDGQVRFPPLQGLPALQPGERYLIFQSRPGALGLSTTIGLGQGKFLIRGRGREALAVNDFGNAGLFEDMAVPGAPDPGPVPYEALSVRVRDQLAR